MKEVNFFLSFIPPSKANKVKINIRAFTKSGKRYIVPKDVSLKINKAIWELQMQNEKIKAHFSKPVEVHITFLLPNKRRRDLDNIMKTLGDCLSYAGIIEDDNLIYKQTLEKFHSKEEGVIIKIKNLRKRKEPDLSLLKEYKRTINGN
ncbi:MAG: RusA family crossover junction endodeoxyribonuclease [Aquificae bacterium]|nr:RusA family crossover junction endodeoxyribonuclease [Aquificota bacterium]